MDATCALIARRFCAARERAGLTQEQAAQAAGLAQSTLSLYERGRRLPQLLLLRSLAVVYGVSTDWLLGLSETIERC